VPDEVKRVEFIAHRGSSYLAPENTLAALKLGWEETSTCEVDVQATADGRLLVIHDDSTQRTTGTNLQVAEHTLSELQRLNAGAFRGEPWNGEKMPSLDEAIAAIPSGKQLLIEIKAGPQVMAELARVIRTSGKEKQLLLHSFNHAVCVEVRKAFPDIPVYFLIAARPDLHTGTWSPSINETLLKITQAGLSGLGANDTPLINAETVQNIHAIGLRLNIWTVDEVSAAKRLVDLGVDTIISNRPGWLKAQLAELK
jgi:glycerophosphoryl diester phosphodiesterase